MFAKVSVGDCITARVVKVKEREFTKLVNRLTAVYPKCGGNDGAKLLSFGASLLRWLQVLYGEDAPACYHC